MAKKVKDEEILTPEKEAQLEAEMRAATIKAYNEQTKDYKILDKEVTDDDKAAAKKAYEDLAKEIEGGIFTLAEADTAKSDVDFLLEFVRGHAFWYKDMWKGFITFEGLLTTWLDEYKTDNTKVFEVNLYALSFLNEIMMNVMGYGMDSVIWMRDHEEQFVRIVEKVGEHIKSSAEKQQLLKKYQERWGAMEQGWYLQIAGVDYEVEQPAETTEQN